ncbi:MAG: hypothetical protein O2948_01245 [Proteobacteria bacterium]|nr:hypothetical protein [Pseudomonadota bacterium]MDA0928215.1 hypothetical protein [Pseudomonadota bacterium]
MNLDPKRFIGPLISFGLVSASVVIYLTIHGLPWNIQQDETEYTVFEIAEFSEMLEESSALAQYGGYLWTLNDSGANAVVHSLGPEGSEQESIPISGAENIDWESMAHDGQYLYVADTGNNANTREVFTIYRIAWPDLLQGEARAELIELRYNDYRSGSPTAHNFDAEGLAVRGDELWLFTKNRGDRQTNLYRFPKIPGSYSPAPQQRLPVDALVTAADIHPETGELALLGVRRNRQTYLWRAPTSDEGVDWSKMVETVIQPADQWEAVLWDIDQQRLLLTHENNRRGFAGLAVLKP